MTDATVSFDEAAAQRMPPDGRDRSTIDFPYLSLDAAVEVTKAVYQRAGWGSCEIDELAAEMGQTVSGAFRLKTSAAKTFGLVEKEGRAAFRLSPLGQRVVQADDEAEARAAAFLAVPLYRAVFERYRGHLLPSAKALEREMAALGVAKKQTDKARQAFERSARESGFFGQGEDRLVQPRVDRDLKPPPIDHRPPDEREGNRGNGGGGNGSGNATWKPLEYQLIDLLKTEGIGEEERSAVWALVQFLTKRRGAS